jgi:hypothetical protein
MEQRWDWGRGHSLRTWRRIIVLLVVESAAVVNIVACVSALVRHDTDLGRSPLVRGSLTSGPGPASCPCGSPPPVRSGRSTRSTFPRR